jgi:hypothetical protein
VPLQERVFELEECVSHVDTNQVDIVMDMIDLDDSGTISYDEFRLILPPNVSDPIEGVHNEVTGLNFARHRSKFTWPQLRVQARWWSCGSPVLTMLRLCSMEKTEIIWRRLQKALAQPMM